MLLFGVPVCSIVLDFVPVKRIDLRIQTLVAHHRPPLWSQGNEKASVRRCLLTSVTTNGKASSVNALIGNMSITTAPMEGETGNGLVTGTSFGSANTSQATGAANGFGNSTATQVGGTTSNVTKAIGAEITFGDGFGDFSASGGGAASFGIPLYIPGYGTAQPLQIGGGGGGFGFTFGGGIGNVSGDAGKSNVYGNAQSAGFGSAQGSSLFGNARDSGGGASEGGGGGNAASLFWGNLTLNGIINERGNKTKIRYSTLRRD
jgi:hypothetical protein